MAGKKLYFHKKWLENIDIIECGFIHDLAKQSGEIRITIEYMKRFANVVKAASKK